MPGSPAAAISQHSILPLFGGGSGVDSSGTAQSSVQWPYSYLPVAPGGQLLRSSSTSSGPAAPAAGTSSSSTSGTWPLPSAALHAAALQHEPGSARVPSSFSQACFEVWIAMELCDGGTLSEQLQQGFHCHPGSETVDMVSENTPPAPVGMVTGTVQQVAMWGACSWGGVFGVCVGLCRR
jgi:hypothetical protein